MILVFFGTFSVRLDKTICLTLELAKQSVDSVEGLFSLDGALNLLKNVLENWIGEHFFFDVYGHFRLSHSVVAAGIGIKASRRNCCGLASLSLWNLKMACVT